MVEEFSSGTAQEQELGEEPPDASIGSIISSFRTRGFKETLNDEGMGPHTHLFVLLGLVFFIAVFVGIYLAVT